VIIRNRMCLRHGVIRLIYLIPLRLTVNKRKVVAAELLILMLALIFF